MRDALLIFGDDIAVADADVDSDTLELEYPDKGEGTVLWWVVKIPVDAAGGTSMQFALMDSDDDITYRDAILTDDILLADLTKGKEIKIGMRYDLQEYVKVQARPTGTFTGATAFSSWIEID
jgi:hypothetical protein